MHTNPLRRILADLGSVIAERGVESEGPAILRMAAAARSTAPGAVAALLDPSSPDVVRDRAFTVISSRLLLTLDDATARQLADELSGAMPDTLLTVGVAA